ERIAPRDDVADHPDVGLERELLGPESRHELDAERLQLIAHGRIDVGVASGHAEACALGERGKSAHEGAADAQDVDVCCHGVRAAEKAAGKSGSFYASRTRAPL